MTVNKLIDKLIKHSRSLTSGEIPVTINGKEVDITDVTLEGNDGTYWVDIKLGIQN